MYKLPLALAYTIVTYIIVEKKSRTGCPGSHMILTTAFVNTRHNPAKLPPATAHPIPCSQVTLASSVLWKTTSNFPTANLSNFPQIPVNFLYDFTKGLGDDDLEVGSSRDGDARGEKDARDASNDWSSKDTM